MKWLKPFFIILLAVAVGAAWLIACSPPRSEPTKSGARQEAPAAAGTKKIGGQTIREKEGPEGE